MILCDSLYIQLNRVLRIIEPHSEYGSAFSDWDREGLALTKIIWQLWNCWTFEQLGHSCVIWAMACNKWKYAGHTFSPVLSCKSTRPLSKAHTIRQCSPPQAASQANACSRSVRSSLNLILRSPSNHHLLKPSKRTKTLIIFIWFRLSCSWRLDLPHFDPSPLP